MKEFYTLTSILFYSLLIINCFCLFFVSFSTSYPQERSNRRGETTSCSPDKNLLKQTGAVIPQAADTPPLNDGDSFVTLKQTDRRLYKEI